MMKKGKKIDILTEALIHNIKVIEQEIESGNYSRHLLYYIQWSERKAKQFLYKGGISPSEDEEIAGKQLLLLELIDYIMKMFPTYSNEVRDNLLLHGNKKVRESEHLISLNQLQKDSLKSIIPKINTYIADGSTFEQWEKVFTGKDIGQKIKIICKNKLLAEFLIKFRRKFHLYIADTDFGKKPYFDSPKKISQRFVEVAARSPITKADKDKLIEIFK